MYTLAVELHGLNQLQRLQPELIADMRRRVISVVEVQGGTFVEQHGSLWVFRFERARPDDRQGVLEALSQSTTLLQARESELSGWSIVLDFLEVADHDASALMHDRLLPVYMDNAAWLGEAAHSLLAHYLETEEAPHDGARLFRVVGRGTAREEELGSVFEWARSRAIIDLILENLVPDELVGGILMLLSDDPVVLRTNTCAALEELLGAEPAVRWLEAEPDQDSTYAPLLSTFRALDVHETGFWLIGPARDVWDERVRLIRAAVQGGAALVAPDSFEPDLLIAFESYLSAYVRRAAESVVPPVLLCHQIDRWPTQALDALSRVLSHMPVPEHEPALLVVATAARSPAGSTARLVRRTVRVPRRGVRDLRSSVDVPVNTDRLFRVTRGSSAAVVHYLMDAGHWDALTDRQLESVTESDLAWRVVCSLDSELQELLLAALYVGNYLTRDQYTEVAVDLGSDRIRVPEALSRLRLLGLIEDRPKAVPVYRDHRERLESALGRSARSVYEKAGTTMLRLLGRGDLVLSEAMMHFLADLDEGEHIPVLYHQLLDRALAERRIAAAQRLLYDAVPPRGFQEQTRSCMQTVLASNRLRLALLQGNLQTAERTRSLSDRNIDHATCDFAAGDLALQKARLTFHGGPTVETTALLKRAVMVYQELDDQAGLARANLDFGLVRLAQEDLLGAREYILIAGRSAANSGDVFEQMRSRQLMLICDYVYGNLSRALDQAAELDKAAADAGMREVQLFAELANGRVLFELGRYGEAAASFSRGRSRGRLYGMAVQSAVMERWLARSLVYDGRVRRGLAILRDQQENQESCFFLSEGLLRQGEHGEAVALLEHGLAMPVPTTGPVEAISWSSGYASIEDRAIGVVAGSGVLRHQMMALRGYILAESGRTEEGVREMHRLTRELRISEIDPYNRIYFYLYSLILPDSGELSLEDGSTVLGKAVRYIQQRTSRMDEYTHKTAFLRENYWNARLMSHAQTHNLV